MLKHKIEPVCKTPHNIVCSPIKSDLTSATNDDSKTPALWPPVETAYAFANSNPSPFGSFSGCTAIKVGTPNPRKYSSLTSVPGHLGATIITVMSFLIFTPSSTILKPCEYDKIEFSFINGIAWLTTAVWFLSGVKFITISAWGTNSSNVPILKLFFEAFKKDSFLLDIEDCLNTYEISKPESLMLRPWFKPWAPHPIITIFLSINVFIPSENSSDFINLHLFSCDCLSFFESELK